MYKRVAAEGAVDEVFAAQFHTGFGDIHKQIRNNERKMQMP